METMIKDVNETFDAITGESFYGMNMKKNMMKMTEEELAVLRNLANLCKITRS
jgi:hypothetical protein